MSTLSIIQPEPRASRRLASPAYAGLSPQAATIARSAARRLRELPCAAIIERGHELLAAKAALPRGRFTRWLAAEVDGSIRTARNHMMVAEVFGDDPATVAALDAGSLYRLARAHAPIRQDITDRAKAGDRPSVNGIARATRRSPEMSEEDFTFRWQMKEEATRDLCRFIEGLHRIDHCKCIGLMELADIDDVLHHFGRKRGGGR